MRDVDAIETSHGGIAFRSRTEARWAVFFETLGLLFEYERTRIPLTTGESYLPDFYLRELDAWFEVKPESDAVVTEEASKARQLSADKPGQRVWLAIGAPRADTANILTLEQWSEADPIEAILAAPENRYCFLEDRRDEGVYWLQADFVTGGFKHSFAVGGPGVSTDHERLPLLHRRVAAAYEAARAQRW